MKDIDDHSTQDMIARASNARRQVAFAARQRVIGRRHRGFWLNDQENAAVVGFIKQLRAGQLDESQGDRGQP